MAMPFKKQRSKPVYIQNREHAKREEWERQQHKNNVEIVRALDRVADQLMTDEKEEERRDSKKTFREYLTIVLVFATVFAAGIGDVFFYGQMREMRRAYGPIATSANAALKQAELIKADQRPWIKIEKIAPMAFPTDPRFGGLMFNGPNTPGLLPLHFLLKNVGRSPAFDIRVGVESVFGFPKVDDLAKEEQAKCVSLDNAFPQTPMVVDSTTFIRVIFPGDEMPYDSALLVMPDQVRKFSTGDAGKEVFQLRFYGCVRYTFANSKEPHQTSFAYRVSHLVDAQIPGGKAIDVTFRPWEDIPPDKIVLLERPMTSGVTN